MPFCLWDRTWGIAWPLAGGLHALAQSPGVDIIKASSVYETDPWGLEDQRPFFNAVVWIRTDLPPMELLRVCQSVERQRDRVRGSAGGQDPGHDILRMVNRQSTAWN
jgi:2-amino-4-hydroxy-6-hydroxymethyldihydropteridine diphosphokinase